MLPLLLPSRAFKKRPYVIPSEAGVPSARRFCACWGGEARDLLFSANSTGKTDSSSPPAPRNDKHRLFQRPARPHPFLLAGLFILLGCGTGAGAQAFPARAKVELIAETTSLQPRQSVWIGVLFDLDKGWHIYWVNPGDSGEPPKIQWQLPSGFHAGEIRWPTPVRLGAGTVIDYGYEGRVLLPVPLQVPAEYKPGTSAMLAADIKYLICREVCIPAKAHATLSLPAGNGNASDAAARRELFRSARENTPKPLPEGSKAQAIDQGGQFVLSIETGARETKGVFFPLEQEQIDNAAAQGVAPSARGVQITLKKSDQLLKPIAMLRGVVVLGPQRAYELAAPITPKR